MDKGQGPMGEALEAGLAESPGQPQFVYFDFNFQDIRFETEAEECRAERPAGGRRFG